MRTHPGTGHQAVPLGRAWDLLERLAHAIRNACPDAIASVAGDARRFEPLVERSVLVVGSSEPVSALDAACALPGIDEILRRTDRGALVVWGGTEIDIRAAGEDDFGTVLFTATGSDQHVRQVLGDAFAVPSAREEDIYSRAGLPWIPPEMRNAAGELEAAIRRELPRLVERSDIRGDLHMHTTSSDGQDSLEAMIAAGAAAGYEYIAITDHSEHATCSRTIDPEGLARQREEIDRLRVRHPGLTILRGIEVDIMSDGSLDCPDEILETLDIVLASLHERLGQDGRELTERCLRAIAHPLVNIVTHPMNRLVGRRDPYPMDFDAIYAAAAESGTALEIDGAPNHLDLDGAHARAAARAGVTLTIDSDSHGAGRLDRQMRLGVGTARRGWVEPRHVLNARPLAQVRAFVAAKRTRG